RGDSSCPTIRTRHACHLVTVNDQMIDEWYAERTCGTGDEDSHLLGSFTGRAVSEAPGAPPNALALRACQRFARHAECQEDRAASHQSGPETADSLVDMRCDSDRLCDDTGVAHESH